MGWNRRVRTGSARETEEDGRGDGSSLRSVLGADGGERREGGAG